MSRFVIQGGRPLSGTLRVSGNKNAVLPMIAASLLTAEKVVLENVPEIADVDAMLDVAAALGTKVRRDRAARTLTLETAALKSRHIASPQAARIRTSFLFAGPLLARSGRAALPPPGGDAIGHRRLDTHFAGFQALGAKTHYSPRSLVFTGPIRGARILLDEASVTATENLLMAAVLAAGHTEIYNAACEPHVVDLVAMLNAMGAKIAGAGTNRLQIDGVESLHGCTARVSSDYIEAGSYIAAAAATGGEVTLEEIDPAPFEILAGPFARFGVTWQIDAEKRTLTYRAKKRRKMQYDLGDTIPAVSDGPWPAFPSDMLSVMIVLASQTRGTCLFFEKMFESRLYFVDHLRQMGAKIVQCDPHRVVVTGPSPLVGGSVVSNDIRAGIALALAALCAKGTSVIAAAETIDRGYPDVIGSLLRLGASVRREG